MAILLIYDALRWIFPAGLNATLWRYKHIYKNRWVFVRDALCRGRKHHPGRPAMVAVNAVGGWHGGNYLVLDTQLSPTKHHHPCAGTYSARRPMNAGYESNSNGKITLTDIQQCIPVDSPGPRCLVCRRTLFNEHYANGYFFFWHFASGRKAELAHARLPSKTCANKPVLFGNRAKN